MLAGELKMDISELDQGQHSYLPEIRKKLEEDAPARELQTLIALEMICILRERERLMDALKPDQINLRKKETLRSLRNSNYVLRGVRLLGKQIKDMHKDRDYIDWDGKKFTYVLQQLVELAVNCLRKTGQSEHTIQNWLQHFRQQFDERAEEICRAADRQ